MQCILVHACKDTNTKETERTKKQGNRTHIIIKTAARRVMRVDGNGGGGGRRGGGPHNNDHQHGTRRPRETCAKPRGCHAAAVRHTESREGQQTADVKRRLRSRTPQRAQYVRDVRSNVHI